MKDEYKRQNFHIKKRRANWLIAQKRKAILKSLKKLLETNQPSESYRIFVRDEQKRLKRSSYKGLTEDALVHGAEEGRDKLRKATGRSKYLEIRRYPNEGTQHE